ncbi:MAG: AAA family ATPase [Gammaproteobacteria bacterium]
MTRKTEQRPTHMMIQGERAKSVPLKALDGDIVHVFEPGHVEAINFAIACGRPLLLTGETGVGKTQLARAAAKALGRAYVRHTCDPRTSGRDLLYGFDAVGRLADAQLAQYLNRGAPEPAAEDEAGTQAGRDADLGSTDPAGTDPRDAAAYLVPGPIWWGFQWAEADGLRRAKLPENPDHGDPANGCVVAIDEIDKADVDVANALLEALGEGSFLPEHRGRPVRVGHVPPLVMLTSNGEKDFPHAFLRRCLVLEMALPPDNSDELRAFLVERGRGHCGGGARARWDTALSLAADALMKDRAAARRQGWSPLPGLAEYIDLLHVVEHYAESDTEKGYDDIIKRAKPYLLKKAGAFTRY